MRSQLFCDKTLDCREGQAPPLRQRGADSPGIGNQISTFCRVVEDADPYGGAARMRRKSLDTKFFLRITA